MVSTGAYGPRKQDALVGEAEEALGEEIAQDDLPGGWPYEKNRLRTVDYEAIIEDGEPWSDPDFPPDASSLFINGESHREAGTRARRKVWEDYIWVRASEHFAELGGFCLFRTIEPEDVK